MKINTLQEISKYFKLLWNKALSGETFDGVLKDNLDAYDNAALDYGYFEANYFFYEHEGLDLTIEDGKRFAENNVAKYAKVAGWTKNNN